MGLLRPLDVGTDLDYIVETTDEEHGARLDATQAVRPSMALSVGSSAAWLKR